MHTLPPISFIIGDPAAAMAGELAAADDPLPSPTPPLRPEEEEGQDPRLHRSPTSVSYHVSISLGGPSSSMPPPTVTAEPFRWRWDACYCFILVLAFWVFASMTVMLGFFGSNDLTLGPYASSLLQPNSLFVQNIKVSSMGSNGESITLYGFSSQPSLDTKKTIWSNVANTSILPDSHDEWIYSLNQGSSIQVSYNITSQHSSALILAIIQDKNDYLHWIEHPTSAFATLSWNLIYGSGEIRQPIFSPSSYYITLFNIGNEPVEAHLEFNLEARLYDTSTANYECSLEQSFCVMKLPFTSSDVSVITSSGPQGEWDIQLYYEPRWMTYILGSGVLTAFILVACETISHFMCAANSSEDTPGSRVEGTATERAPLLANKADECMSSGSSYESISHDEEEGVGGDEEHAQGSGGDHSESLCVICFDAQKDCFFLPCGHRTTCFTCGMRILQEAGTCPVCRRMMKKVKKIFTV